LSLLKREASPSIKKYFLSLIQQPYGRQQEELNLPLNLPANLDLIGQRDIALLISTKSMETINKPEMNYA